MRGSRVVRARRRTTATSHSGPGRTHPSRGLPTSLASCTSAEVERRIAQGPVTTRAEDPAETDGSSGSSNVRVGGLIFLAMLAIYVVSNPDRVNFYNHFVWQASAWLEGQAGIRFPVSATSTSPGNDYFQDVLPILDPNGSIPGRALIPFPPLPAVLLVPFVAVFGLTTNAQLIATFIGAIDVALAFWMLGRLPLDRPVRVATTIFLGLGTVLWLSLIHISEPTRRT